MKKLLDSKLEEIVRFNLNFFVSTKINKSIHEKYFDQPVKLYYWEGISIFHT